MPDHAGGGIPNVGALVAVLLAGLALIGYRALVVQCRRRERSWHPGRSLAWTSGVVVAALAVIGPIADLTAASYPGHMVAHLLLGMVAPVLLVLGAPVTLALRALPLGAARRLTTIMSARLIRILTEPVVAATLVIGGAWVLYATPAYGIAHGHQAVGALVQVHLVAAGYLLTTALVGVDPMPHRRGIRHRSVVLVLAFAAHDILAKHLYAHPPGGVDVPAAELGAMVMYYGGTIVDLTLAFLLCGRWYRQARPRTSALQDLALARDPLSGCRTS